MIEVSEAIFQVRSDDGTMPDDWPPAVIFNLIRQALQKLGRVSPEGEYLRRTVEEAGFEDVTVKAFKLPIGPWPKRPNLKQAGLLLAHASQTGYESYALQLLTQVLEMPEKEVLDLCEKAKAVHTQPGATRVHAYYML